MSIASPPADSTIHHEVTSEGTVLSWDERSPKDAPTFIVLVVLTAVWIAGLIVPTAAFTLAVAPAILWLVVWGGVGLLVIGQGVRRVFVGRHQRMVFTDKHIEFQPKIRAAKKGLSEPMTKQVHQRHGVQNNRVPLRIEDITPDEIESVGEPKGRRGLWLHTTPGNIRLTSGLSEADQAYLHEAIKGWKAATPTPSPNATTDG